jgi:homoserine O-acetyltransferase/O-succinyltransferase
LIPEFELESGEILREVPVAYKTYGTLNDKRNNVMVICHALTGSSDVGDWWGPLMGRDMAMDPSKFFIICINALGSPYGSASPCTIDPETGTYYGPEFPLATVKDDARLQKMLLDDLGINQIAVVLGGSMGGMLALEYAYFGPDYVKTVIAIATCACHSAWGISWGEAQRQSIYSDPKYLDGYYKFDDPPVAGLGAARMAAMLTYRSRNSFESKFGRAVPDPAKHKCGPQSRLPETPEEERWLIHNHGHLNGKRLSSPSEGSPVISRSNSITDIDGKTSKRPPQHYFTAQSYLRYQAHKFVQRFDSNCYIAITRKLDTHDVSRGRGDDVEQALKLIQQPTLVIGISSDGLFTFTEQERLAEHIPHSELVEIDSPEGHDAFLLEFVEINKHIVKFLGNQLPEITETEGVEYNEEEVEKVSKSSVFGAEKADDLDVTSW